MPSNDGSKLIRDILTIPLLALDILVGYAAARFAVDIFPSTWMFAALGVLIVTIIVGYLLIMKLQTNTIGNSLLQCAYNFTRKFRK